MPSDCNNGCIGKPARIREKLHKFTEKSLVFPRITCERELSLFANVLDFLYPVIGIRVFQVPVDEVMGLYTYADLVIAQLVEVGIKLSPRIRIEVSTLFSMAMSSKSVFSSFPGSLQ